MTDKKKKRIREHAAKTGMSYQASANALTRRLTGGGLHEAAARDESSGEGVRRAMSVVSMVKFPVPESAQQFERLATDVVGRMLGCRFERHGRSGQDQQGVDAYAMPKAGQVIGLQHRNRAQLTIASVRKAIIEAEAFVPALTDFIFTTSTPRDAGVQRGVREINAQRLSSGRFRVAVMFWDDLCDELSGQPDLIEKYSSTYVGASGVARGAERARAWVHQVLNPWIEALDERIWLLSRRSLAWHFYDRQSHRITRLAACVANARTLEDFARAHEDLVPHLTRQDELLRRATALACTVCDELASAPQFRADVLARLDEYNRGRETPEQPQGSHHADELPALIAQHILNNIVYLRPGRTDAEFWKKYADEFRAMGSNASCDELRVLLKEFGEEAVALRSRLSDLHFRYCETYGINAAP